MGGDSLFEFGEGDLDFEADLDFLAEGGHFVEENEGSRSALHDLSRSISGQYVEVLASFASQSLGGRSTEATRGQVVSALDALLRLGGASADEALVAVLEELRDLLPQSAVMGGTARRDFMRDMQAWVLKFAELLDESDADRMRGLVTFERGSIPLLDEIGEIRGIGPKRLERLYCAGLFSVEMLHDADPIEVAHVTGLPGRLAEDVVDAARRFAEAERERCLSDLIRRAEETHRRLEKEVRSGRPDPQLVTAVRHALEELEAAAAILGDTGENT